MSEMVDRVAEAISMALAGDDRGFPDYAALARSAILAMREPTEAMADAGFDAMDQDYDVKVAMSSPSAAWQAMIDEALK